MTTLFVRLFILVSLLSNPVLATAQEAEMNSGISESETQETCTDIENDERLGPIRDQGRADLSHAFAAADLISHKIGKSVSAIDIAIGYNAAFRKGDITFSEKFLTFFKFRVSTPLHESFDIDGLRRSVEVAANRGVCDESQIRSSPLESEGDLLATLNSVVDLHQELGAKEKNPSRITDLLKAAKELFPSLDEHHFTNAGGKNSERWLELANLACDGKRFALNDLKAREILPTDSRDSGPLLDKADDILDQGDILGLTFDHRFIYDQFHKSMRITRPHYAALIVGRRKNPRTLACEYKIRNSWGNTCDTVRPDLCFDGNLWITRDELKSKLQSVTYIP